MSDVCGRRRLAKLAFVIGASGKLRGFLGEPKDMDNPSDFRLSDPFAFHAAFLDVPSAIDDASANEDSFHSGFLQKTESGGIQQISSEEAKKISIGPLHGWDDVKKLQGQLESQQKMLRNFIDERIKEFGSVQPDNQLNINQLKVLQRSGEQYRKLRSAQSIVDFELIQNSIVNCESMVDSIPSEADAEAEEAKISEANKGILELIGVYSDSPESSLVKRLNAEEGVFFGLVNAKKRELKNMQRPDEVGAKTRKFAEFELSFKGFLQYWSNKNFEFSQGNLQGKSIEELNSLDKELENRTRGLEVYINNRVRASIILAEDIDQLRELQGRLPEVKQLRESLSAQSILEFNLIQESIVGFEEWADRKGQEIEKINASNATAENTNS